ncbi:MAG: protoheme IX farnesyltransferase [Flavobacteriales bacterium]|nr:protoheme IX farnesyltransferase [Flavobacteriales bacterium]|tara:strand:+ start:677 stop:1558 length:882 start_codon:yes stop_codon:yes gene_type:complete
MLKNFTELLKFKLSATVVFSAIVGYLLGFDTFDIYHFSYLILGGFLVTGSANTFNQIIEVEKDKLMQRTLIRPLPKGNLTILQATIFALFTALLGLLILNKINPQGTFYGVMSKSSFFGLISIFLYVLSYTPLKRVSTISIFVGAIPGAIPFLLGYVAATDDFGLAAGTLFAIQFFWQFPHFIAIAWVQHDDYKKAGFKMLFGGEKSKYPALIAVLTSVIMTFVSVLPFFYTNQLNLSVFAFVVILMLGIWFTLKAVNLYNSLDDISARNLMLSSFIYLPIMQILYVIDRFLF